MMCVLFCDLLKCFLPHKVMRGNFREFQPPVKVLSLMKCLVVQHATIRTHCSDSLSVR